MATKEILHRLVDELPDSAWGESERHALALRTDDAVLRALLAACLDDERETDEERAGVQEARE